MKLGAFEAVTILLATGSNVATAEPISHTRSLLVTTNSRLRGGSSNGSTVSRQEDNVVLPEPTAIDLLREDGIQDILVGIVVGISFHPRHRLRGNGRERLRMVNHQLIVVVPIIIRQHRRPPPVCVVMGTIVVKSNCNVLGL